jgi:hypothetical protein
MTYSRLWFRRLRLASRWVAVLGVMGAVALGAASIAGCSAGGGGQIPDAGSADAVFEVALNLPDGCPPPIGNDKGVGKPCTRGGGECGPTTGDLHCTCDNFLGIRLDGVPCLCTILTVNSTPDAGDLCASLPADHCGSTASCCPYMSAGTYCAPSICLAAGVCPDVSAGGP